MSAIPSSARTAPPDCDSCGGGVPIDAPYFDTIRATTSAPATKPQAAPIPKTRADERPERAGSTNIYSVNTTRVPGLTSAASFSASQFVRRTHPCDCVRPIVAGSGVPCRP